MDSIDAWIILWFTYGIIGWYLDKDLPLPFVAAGVALFLFLASERLSRGKLPEWAGWALGVLFVLLASVEI
jgi:hypothetical protein